jgi:hypothetical protein
VATFSAGVEDDGLSTSIKSASPEFSFGYEPSKMFSFRGDFHSSDAGVSYTAISPHTLVAGHGQVEFRPFARLSIHNDLTASASRLLDSAYHNSVRADSTIVSYALNERFSVFAGFSYESFSAVGDIVFVRGTPPLNHSMQDQEINRVWQGGVEVRPVKRFEAKLSGNYDNSSGVGRISGEPPAYGPVTWPLVTGTVAYDFPRAGKLSIDLQRTYYAQQIVTVNNFSANLLTIRWTRDF